KAEVGIRCRNVTGVQTCALPISAVIESQKGTEVSCHPMSSTRKTMIFGWLVAFCCALVKYCNPKIKTNIINPIFLSLLTIIIILDRKSVVKGNSENNSESRENK